jgi:Autochaperone Domain Type 1
MAAAQFVYLVQALRTVAKRRRIAMQMLIVQMYLVLEIGCEIVPCVGLLRTLSDHCIDGLVPRRSHSCAPFVPDAPQRNVAAEEITERKPVEAALRASERQFHTLADSIVGPGGTLNQNGFNQTVANLSNAGLVNMGNGTPPGTLLTTTDYVGNGGTIAMNTFLEADNSPSDKLVINGGSATSAEKSSDVSQTQI